jgi:hypothetical protein
MASWIKVRGISRSQKVRIGDTKVTNATTVAIDIDSTKIRRDFQHYQALGSLVVVGSASPTVGDAVTSGAAVDQGVSATDLALAVSAGTLRKASDGSTVAIAAATPSVGAADGTNPRIDNVIVDTTTGAATVQGGTAAAVPAAPAVAAGKVKIAEVLVPANDTAITNDQITDWTTSRYVVAS